MEKPDYKTRIAGDKKSPKERGTSHAPELPTELIPFRDEMKAWIDAHLDDVHTFLEYGKKFNLVYGTDFYHKPGKVNKPDTISLDVSHYKRLRERGISPEHIIFFATLHEFAHLKTMLEMDLAGKHNHVAHYNYEAHKTIRDKKDPTRFVRLQPTYREFYNISEDVIVNFLVQNTRHYGVASGSRSREARQEIVDLYTHIFFAMYKKTNAGEGSYVKNEDKNTRVHEPYTFVGEGKGNFEVLTTEDYAQGFDWNEVQPELKRSGQFLTFFMKHYMIGLPLESVHHEKLNPTGTHRLHEDVTEVLHQPLVDVYETLLKKVVAKYGSDAAQWKRYSECMRTTIAIPVFHMKDGTVVESEKSDVVHTVASGKAFFAKDGMLNVALAKKLYRDELSQCVSGMGISGVFDIRYTDFFDQFKTLLRGSGTRSLTFPLKYNLHTRTRIIRKVLEPIFTLLCILDDSFDISLPPEIDGEGIDGEPGGGKSEQQEKPEWQKGEKVINIDGKSPHKGKKGVITDITYDANGAIQSVTVEYYKE